MNQKEGYNRLIIIRKDESTGRWVVDQDSEHILENDGGGYPFQELHVRTIRALVQTDDVSHREA